MSPYFKKMDRSSVVQYVIGCLTDAMLNGDLKPGDRIPTELELSEQLGVARNSVREAVKILCYLGVLEIRRASGTFVSSGFSDTLVDPMIYGIILNQQNTKELNELRAMMESGVLRLAIQKGTPEEIAVLRERLGDLKEAIFAEGATGESVFPVDNAFHDTITSMGHNSMISKINGVALLLTNATRKHSVERMIAQGRQEELYRAHEKVFQLVENHRTEGLYESVLETYFEEEEV